MARSPGRRRGVPPGRVVNQTRLILLAGATALGLLFTCIAVSATIGGIRDAVMLFGYPSLWLLMVAVHFVTDPPLVITLPHHPDCRSLIKQRTVVAPFPRSRALADARRLGAWMLWGLVLYLPLILPLTIDLAFIAGSATLALHALVRGLLGIRAYPTWCCSRYIAGERQELTLSAEDDRMRLAPEVFHLDTWDPGGRIATTRGDFSLSLLRMTIPVRHGWMASVSQRTIQHRDHADDLPIQHEGGIDFDLEDLAHQPIDLSNRAPAERSRMFTWFDWKLEGEIRVGRAASSRVVFRFPAMVAPGP